MISTRILLLGVVATQLGCSSELEKMRKTYGVSLEAKLAQVAAVGKAVEALPPLTTDDEKIALPAVSGGESRTATVAGSLRPHVAYMYSEAFADLTENGPSFGRIAGANPLNSCAALLRKQRCPSDCSYAECSCYHKLLKDRFAACDRVEVLLVIRTLEFGEPNAPTFVETRLAVTPDARAVTPPVPKPAPRVADAGVADGRQRDGGVAPDSRGPDSRRPDARVIEHWAFRGGVLRGEVHVYALAGAKRLGGFRFQVASPPVEVVIRYADEQRGAVSATQLTRLKARFAEVVQKTIGDACRRHIPTAFVR